MCPHGFYHRTHTVHSCDGCWCEGRADRQRQGWMHDTTPVPFAPPARCMTVA